MTTSGRGRNATTKPPSEPKAVPNGAIPEDEQELRHEIEQTREQLGETVGQLVAKADVKGRARAKAARLAGWVKGSTAQLRAKAAERGAGVRGQAAGKTVLARQKALAGKDQLQARLAPVWEAAPESLRDTVSKGARTVNQRRVPLAMAATLLAGYLTLRWWRKR
jgi:hypothetical protein